MRRGTPIGIVFAACLASLAGSAIAQDAEAIDCDAAVTQSAMTMCAERDYETADAALNAAYRKTMARAEAADKDLAGIGAGLSGAVDALKTAQRAWIGYRDGQCALAGFEAHGGSMEPVLVAGCLADLTGKRTEELNAVLAEP